jgi:hypothetical protein
MAHFAKIDENNIVTQVVVVDDSQQSRGQEFLSNDIGLGGVWLQTSYNTRGGIHINGGTPFRKNYAGVGYTYDSVKDAFIPPNPYSTWILNETTCCWESPIPYPKDGKNYVWSEANNNWIAVVV